MTEEIKKQIDKHIADILSALMECPDKEKVKIMIDALQELVYTSGKMLK